LEITVSFLGIHKWETDNYCMWILTVTGNSFAMWGSADVAVVVELQGS
jgi:hypothetical protein